MSRVGRHTVLVAVLAALTLTAGPKADAAGIYGTIHLYDLKTEEVKPVEGLYRIEAIMSGQRVKTVSKSDGTYRMHVGRRGAGEISLTHRGQRLTTTFESRYYDRNYELFIQYYEGRYRLIARSQRIRQPRRDTPQD